MRNALGRPVDSGADASGSDDGHQVGDPDVDQVEDPHLLTIWCTRFGGMPYTSCPSKCLLFSYKSFVTCFPGQWGKPSFG
jgi:hypothetical protein